MTMARKHIIIEGERGVYHCMARCVRRAYLCGVDAYSGKNFEHRRKWVRDRLHRLSQLFVIDVFAYSVMSNHWHSVIRTRPDLLATIGDEDIVRRWMRVFPKKREGSPEERAKAVENEVTSTLRDPKRVKLLRERLGSVSWFMKSMNEYIARRGNREDEVTGRFWEGRFKCQSLLDDASILTCMVYVDLNPVRAGIADSLDDYEFTSAYDRIQACAAKQRLEKVRKSPQVAPVKRVKEIERHAVKLTAASWLVDLEGGDSPIYGLSERTYLNLVDLTGRRIHSRKEGVISSDVLPILESLEIDSDAWVKNVERYGKLFYRVAGRAENIMRAAKKAGLNWLKGKEGSRQLFKPKITLTEGV